MLIFRIIFAIAILFGIFLLPWWLVAIIAVAFIATFDSAYEIIALALVSDLFYSHQFFSVSIFIPVGAIAALILVLISNRIRDFVI
jgi:hypothetical protein